MTSERTLTYYKNIILPKILNSNNIIISAHGNSIRAIVMEIFNLSSSQILKTEIGWCEPWKISYNKDGKLLDYKIIPPNQILHKTHQLFLHNTQLFLFVLKFFLLLIYFELNRLLII